MSDSTDEREIRAVIDRTAEAFSRLDFSAWLDNFHTPRVIMLPNGAISPEDGADLERHLAEVVDSLQARGYTATVVDRCQTRLLTPVSAIATAMFTRYAGDEVLETAAATYVLQKRDDRWGAVLVMGHGPEVSVVRD